MSGKRKTASEAPQVRAIVVPHPRHAIDLHGHDAVEAQLMERWQAGKLPHALLLSGMKGIGKAALAYRFARFVLAGGGQGEPGLFGAQPSLHVDPHDPVFKRIAAGSHADLLTVEPNIDEKTGERKAEITIDNIRRINAFLSLTPAEGAWRVVIIDSGDEMNRNAANAVLKILEEPPSYSLIILISHQPSRLLPTIRSRCHAVRLAPPDARTFHKIVSELCPDIENEELQALEQLSHRTAGLAVEMYRLGAIGIYKQLLALMEELPHPDADRLQGLADLVTGKENAALWEMMERLLPMLLARCARFAAGDRALDEIAAGERALFERLAAGHPATFWVEQRARAEELLSASRRLYLDKKQAIFSLFQAVAGNIEWKAAI